MKYSFFHKPSKKDDILLMLRNLTVRNHVIERQVFIKFLEVLIDENLNWKEHIKYYRKQKSKIIRTTLDGHTFFRQKFSTSSLLLIYMWQYLQSKP